jgi:hypothetical protein
LSPKKKSRSRKIRRAISEAMDRLVNKKKAAPDVAAAEEPIGLEHEEELLATSRRAVRYQPHRAPGVAFLDSRRQAYGGAPDGSLRANRKPRSRVKRLRDERAKQNKTDQGTRSA